MYKTAMMSAYDEKPAILWILLIYDCRDIDGI